MRRALLLVGACLVMSLLFAPAAAGQTSDVDCPQLTYDQAQRILAQDTSDPNRLDADDDGIACEGSGTSMDGGMAPSVGLAAPGQPIQDDVDCAAFISAAGNPSQFQAQQFFDANNPAQDPFNLDADGDGLACEGLETGAPEDEATRTPVTPAEGIPHDVAPPFATGASQQPASAAQYDDGADDAAAPMSELPNTGGPSFEVLAFGAGAVLLGGGLLLRHRLS